MKVAINKCWGGFALSQEAVILARKLSGNDKWANVVLPGEYYFDGSGPVDKFMDSYFPDIERHDNILIKIIETLGKKANGKLSNLHIVEIPDNTNYEIDDYDGQESIHEKHQSWG